MVEEIGGRTLKTTGTSLRILELILEYDGLALAELDGMIDGPKSSIHSHLSTLHQCRYVVREGDTYVASFRLWSMGQRAKHRYPVKVAEEVVDDLAATTGEEANFTALEHGRLLIVYGASEGAPLADNDVGVQDEHYLHNTAAGKAILAEMEREAVEAVIDRWGMPQETQATIRDRDQLLDSLAEISERGYGIVDEESAPGLVVVGAPVHDADDTIIGGLSVGGPKYRIDFAALHSEIANELLEAVEEFERALRADRS